MLNKFSVSLFVLFIITLLPNQNPEATNDLITTTCEKTMYKDLCIASLKSDQGSQGANLQGLGKISLKIALANANEIHGYIPELLEKSKQPCVQECLKDCSENFEEAILQIKDSVEAMDSEKYNDVNTWVTGAMSNAESCEDGFKEKPGCESPLVERNTKFSQLCSISLTMSNLLAGVP